MRGHHDSAVSPRWYVPAVPADPCAVCFSESHPHACSVSIAQPCILAVTVTECGPLAFAFPCAFARAVRDA